LVAYKIKFIYFPLVFFHLAAASGLAQLHARPSAINECWPKRQWPKGKCQYAKKKKCGKLQQGPFIYQIVLVFPTQPLAINLKDRHKSNAFLALIKDAYCPHRFLFLQLFFWPFLQKPCHVRFKSNA